jgi:RNA polymerase sigma-70 factor (ECF subfamily)
VPRTSWSVNIRPFDYVFLHRTVLTNEAALILPLAPSGGSETADANAAAQLRARLVASACAGNRAAFAKLYRAHVRLVHGLLLARVPRTDVDDLVQEVFLTAMRCLTTLREPAAFPGWLAAIARNHATDHLRRRGPETVELSDNVAASADESQRARVVLDAVRSLPEAYRETLILRLVEGMTGPEIAVRTGLTEGSVRVNLHRGMKLLREKLER